jgi:hypothetical protein
MNRLHTILLSVGAMLASPFTGRRCREHPVALVPRDHERDGKRDAALDCLALPSPRYRNRVPAGRRKDGRPRSRPAPSRDACRLASHRLGVLQGYQRKRALVAAGVGNHTLGGIPRRYLDA